MPAIGLAAPSSPSAGEAARGDPVLIPWVEEFVIAAEPARRPPEPYRGPIDRLGDPSGREREAASRRLEDVSAADRRRLFRGRRHPDLGVRLRPDAIPRRLGPCPACGVPAT